MRKLPSFSLYVEDENIELVKELKLCYIRKNIVRGCIVKHMIDIPTGYIKNSGYSLFFNNGYIGDMRSDGEL